MNLLNNQQCRNILESFGKTKLQEGDDPIRVLANICNDPTLVTVIPQSILDNHYNSNVEIMKWDFENKGYPIEITEGEFNGEGDQYYIVRLITEETRNSGQGYGGNAQRNRKADDTDRKSERKKQKFNQYVNRASRHNKPSKQYDHADGGTRQSKATDKPRKKCGRKDRPVVAVGIDGNILAEFQSTKEAAEHYGLKHTSCVTKSIRKGCISRKAKVRFMRKDDITL